MNDDDLDDDISGERSVDPDLVASLAQDLFLDDVFGAHAKTQALVGLSRLLVDRPRAKVSARKLLAASALSGDVQQRIHDYLRLDGGGAIDQQHNLELSCLVGFWGDLLVSPEHLVGHLVVTHRDAVVVQPIVDTGNVLDFESDTEALWARHAHLHQST